MLLWQDQIQTRGMPPSNRNSRLQPPCPAPDAGSPVAAAVEPAPGHMASQIEEFAVWFADIEGNITGSNLAVTRMLGYAPPETLGKKLAAFFSLDGETKPGQKQSSIVDSTLKDGQCQSRARCRSKSGRDVPGWVSLSLLRKADSAPVGLVCLFIRDGQKAETHPSSAKTQSAEEDQTTRIVCREMEGTQFVLASPVMHEFIRMVDRVAGQTETVLITGETGAGKELIARTIHQSSNRRGRPWVDINCAALPENLVESELFGYEKGAFSGADSSKPGLFELADKGTLFLDEIGELQLQTQVKLLRVLDGQPFYRLGGHRKIKVDVRIVAATNQDLEAAVREGRFRQDLFHRLGQFQLRVPPLRERPEDTVALAEHFLRLKTPAKSFAPDAISTLIAHSWPGNIRELRNLVAKVAMESNQTEIDAAKITAAFSGGPVSLRQSASMPVGNLESMEEQMIMRALERTGGQRTLAAEQLGISRRTLSRKLKEYNIHVTPGDSGNSLAAISLEQQKFFRARVQLAVSLKNQQGDEASVQGVNLSTGGMGLQGLHEPLRFAGLLDVSFPLPDTDVVFRAKAHLVWIGDESRVGLRFAVIEPVLFEHLQHWTNRKMQEEGWEFPA